MILSSPPELTTAATDLALGLVALVLHTAYARGEGRAARAAREDAGRTRAWRLVFLAAAAGALLGVPAHALRDIAGSSPPDPEAQTVYWAFLGIVLFGLQAAMGAAALRDRLGPGTSRRPAIALGAAAALAWLAYFLAAVLHLVAGYFVVFIAFSALVMLAVLLSYASLYVRDRKAGHLMIAAGVGVAVAGSLVQAGRSAGFTLVWEFDYNSVYHLFMIVAMLLFYAGARRTD